MKKNVSMKCFRRILAMVLVLTLVFTSSVTSYADDSVSDPPSEKEIINELNDGISNIVKNAGEAKALAKDVAELSSLQKAFNSFMTVASTAGTILSVVNGSVTFLRMIGLMEDPSEHTLMNIANQLQAIDDKVSEIDTKINEITNMMERLQSYTEFKDRVDKAENLKGNWTDFTYRYCEDGLDRLMDEYNAKYLNGMTAWCKNTSSTSRIIGDVDNNSIFIYYKKTDSGYELTYTSENGIPSGFTQDDRYILISSSRIPESVTWNIDTYQDTLRSYLRDSISSALLGVDHSGVEVYNYQELYDNLNTRYQSQYINQIVDDAVSTLVYRITSAKLNEDASFTREVIRYYNNYCTHLQTAEEGLDAIMKTFYLTHAFEGEISEDLTEFCNLYSVKNGIYGTFVANVLGASETASDAEKKNAMSEFNDSMKFIQQAKENSLTGYSDYCYITNSRLYLSDISFVGQENVTVENTSYYDRKYISASSKGISVKIDQEFPEGSAMLSEVPVLLLAFTAQSGGSQMNFDYLKEHAYSAGEADYGQILTSYGNEIPFDLDGSTLLQVRHVTGDYFSSNTITQLPANTSASYLAVRTKITGGVYNMATGGIASGKTLFAMAAYGEDHWYWLRCETALMAGPADNAGFTFSSSSSSIGDNKYLTELVASTHYNMLMSVPVQTPVESKGYSPLVQYTVLNEELNDKIQPIEPETEPETEPATDPSTDPATDPSTDPSTEPETVVPESSTDSGTNVDPADTGDTSQIKLYIALLAASAVALSTAVIVVQKRKHF